MEDTNNKFYTTKRKLYRRVIYSILWFIPLMLLLNVIVLIVSTATSHIEATTAVAAKIEGERDMNELLDVYGSYLIVFELVFWFTLSVFGILPGTSKYAESYNKTFKRDAEKASRPLT